MNNMSGLAMLIWNSSKEKSKAKKEKKNKKTL